MRGLLSFPAARASPNEPRMFRIAVESSGLQQKAGPKSRLLLGQLLWC